MVVFELGVLTFELHVLGMQRGVLGPRLRLRGCLHAAHVGRSRTRDRSERVHDPHDARATVLTITDEGSQALADWRAELAGAVAPLLSDLSDDDWAAIARTVEILGASA